MNPIVPLVLAFQFSVGGTPAREVDRLVAEDKFKHFFMSFAVTTAGHAAVRTTGLPHRTAAIAAAGGAAIAGLGKELGDQRRGGRFSGADLVWNGLGIGAGLTLASRTR